MVNSPRVAWNQLAGDALNDPNLALLRLDAERAEIWEDASSLLAGRALLLFADPRKDCRDKVAEVDLRR